MLRAVDTGYGFTKAIGFNQVSFPSAVGDYRPIRFNTGLETAELIDRLAIVYQGKKYFVGPITYLQSNPRITLSAERFTSPEGMALLMSALILTAESQTETIKLVGGLPVAEYARMKDSYTDILRGQHRVSLLGLDGDCSGPFTFNIEEVRLLPQPVGTLFNQVLDDAGQLKERRLAGGRLAVIDIGRYTVDLALLDALQFVDKSSTSFNDLGLFSGYKDISHELKQKQGLDLPADELEPYLTGGKYLKGLNMIKEYVFASLAERICSRVLSTWGELWSFDKIYIAGGGALVLGDYIKQGLQVEQAEVTEAPTMSNCQGYYKFGKRCWG
jgi:plasmid segregation protein ParM